MEGSAHDKNHRPQEVSLFKICLTYNTSPLHENLLLNGTPVRMEIDSYWGCCDTPHVHVHLHCMEELGMSRGKLNWTCSMVSRGF